MKKCNNDLENFMKEKGIKKWMLADYLGCCEMTVTRMFRHEMTDEKKQEIMQVILDNEKEGDQ